MASSRPPLRWALQCIEATERSALACRRMAALLQADPELAALAAEATSEEVRRLQSLATEYEDDVEDSRLRLLDHYSVAQITQAANTNIRSIA